LAELGEGQRLPMVNLLQEVFPGLARGGYQVTSQNAPRSAPETVRPGEVLPTSGRCVPMPRYALEAIIVVLVILWLLGWLVVPLGGSLVHLLLVVILIVVLVRLLRR
jgi:Flp pilus assembly protein TadB